MPIFYVDSKGVQSSLFLQSMAISGSIFGSSILTSAVGFTGSIFGTASIAINATASFVTASNLVGLINTSSLSISSSLSRTSEYTSYYEYPVQKIYSKLSSSIKVWPLNLSTPAGQQGTVTSPLLAQSLYLVAVYIPRSITINGTIWLKRTNPTTVGSSGCNRVGLYTYSAGTLTMVATSSNNSTIWTQGSLDTVITASFTSPYVASRGTHYIAFESNFGSGPSVMTYTQILTAANLWTLDFTNSAKLVCRVANSSSNFPSSIAMSTTAVYTTHRPSYMCLY